MKKKLIIILMLILGCVLALKLISKPFANSDTIIGRISNILNKNNTIELKCIGINKENIDIIWYPEMTDTSLIVKRGEEVGKIGYDYGPNKFEIHLRNGLQFSVGHSKTNNWHSHNYVIEIQKDNKGYTIKFIASGPDFQSYEQVFNLNGVPNGLICGYFENGDYSYKGNFINGLRHGQFLYYHKNGKLRSKLSYVEDEPHGYEITYDENGNIKWKNKYINGQKVKNSQ